MKHSTISDGVADKIESEAALRKLGIRLKAELIEPCYTPIVQSGGQYNLSPSAQSDDKNLTYDVVVAAMGARYRNYCSNVARTYFIDPPKTLERAYKCLLAVQQKCIDSLKPGVELGAVYEAAEAMVLSKAPELAGKLTKNVRGGFLLVCFSLGFFTWQGCMDSKGGGARLTEKLETGSET